MSVIWSPFLLLYQNTFTCFCCANFVMPLDVFRYSPSLRKWPCLGVFHGTCPQGVFGHLHRFPALHAWQKQALQQTCKCLPAAPDWMDAICVGCLLHDFKPDQVAHLEIFHWRHVGWEINHMAAESVLILTQQRVVFILFQDFPEAASHTGPLWFA